MWAKNINVASLNKFGRFIYAFINFLLINFFDDAIYIEPIKITRLNLFLC